jgi:hypothetical protein
MAMEREKRRWRGRSGTEKGEGGTEEGKGGAEQLLQCYHVIFYPRFNFTVFVFKISFAVVYLHTKGKNQCSDQWQLRTSLRQPMGVEACCA